MCHEFVRFLRGGIQRHGMIHALMDREWHMLIGAVHRAARCIDEMLYPMLATTLKNSQCPQHIAVRIDKRVLDTIPNTRLGTHVHHAPKPFAIKEPSDSFRVRQIKFYKTERWMPLKDRKSGLFQCYVIVLIEVIQPNNLIATSQ